MVQHMKTKKIIAAALCFALATGITACSGEEKDTSNESGTAAQTETSAQTEAPVETEAPEETEAPAETEAAATETTAAETEPFVLTDAGYLPEYETFEVTSEDLTDGVWNDAISKTMKGENVSPALSWDSVDGASYYVIYMVDMSGGCWLHWKDAEVTETNLPRGYASTLQYVGPYPPSGATHTYDIYVIAMRNPVERVMGAIDTQNLKFANFIRGLDIDAEGNSGNIIAYGYLSGTFTAD